MARESVADLKCPHCLQINSTVKDCSGLKSGLWIIRHRKCGACGKRFVTHEMVTHYAR